VREHVSFACEYVSFNKIRYRSLYRYLAVAEATDLTDGSATCEYASFVCKYVSYVHEYVSFACEHVFLMKIPLSMSIPCGG